MITTNYKDLIEIRTASDCCVIVYVDDTTIGLELANIVIEILTRALLVNRPLWLCEYIPSYTSLLIEFSLYEVDHFGVNALLKKLVSQAANEIKHCLSEKSAVKKQLSRDQTANPSHAGESEFLSAKRIHRIPVCYQLNSLQTDLAKVAKDKNVSEDIVVNLHCATVYRVFATGFMPGFAYLGELPVELSQPRLNKPRLKVPKGAVAIADRQTAIYPDESPGGWHIIGYTPLDLLFNSTNVDSVESGHFEALLRPGDYVEFYPVSESEYINWVHS
jgi:KipI family sensor histidine kinase inhibitor